MNSISRLSLKTINSLSLPCLRTTRIGLPCLKTTNSRSLPCLKTNFLSLPCLKTSSLGPPKEVSPPETSSVCHSISVDRRVMPITFHRRMKLMKTPNEARDPLPETRWPLQWSRGNVHVWWSRLFHFLTQDFSEVKNEVLTLKKWVCQGWREWHQFETRQKH